MLTTGSPIPEGGGTPARRPRSRLAALASGLALAALGAGLLAPAPASAAPSCTSNNQQGTLCVSATDAQDPVAYSTPTSSSYILYQVLVQNASRSSNLSHVGIIDTIPDGTSFVRATPSVGTCTGGSTVTCALGSLSAGQSATVNIVVTAPSTSDPAAPDITITNSVVGFFDENFNDQPGGKQDTTVPYLESTTVSLTAGQTFVPKGETGQVGTDPTLDQYGNTTITDASTDVLATIQLLGDDSFCSTTGTVKVGKKTYVCRDGGFVEVSVLDASTGQHYSNGLTPLVFHLRWDSDLVSGKQTVKNFVVFYLPDGDTNLKDTQVFSNRCNKSSTNLPCLRNINKNSDGSWSVDLVKADNGRMR